MYALSRTTLSESEGYGKRRCAPLALDYRCFSNWMIYQKNSIDSIEASNQFSSALCQFSRVIFSRPAYSFDATHRWCAQHLRFPLKGEIVASTVPCDSITRNGFASLPLIKRYYSIIITMPGCIWTVHEKLNRFAGVIISTWVLLHSINKLFTIFINMLLRHMLANCFNYFIFSITHTRAPLQLNVNAQAPQKPIHFYNSQNYKFTPIIIIENKLNLHFGFLV